MWKHLEQKKKKKVSRVHYLWIQTIHTLYCFFSILPLATVAINTTYSLGLVLVQAGFYKGCYRLGVGDRKIENYFSQFL